MPPRPLSSDRHIVITGGAGYVGSRVTAYLPRAITVFDKLVYGAEALLPFHRHERLELIRGDVRDTREQACAVDSAQSWSINATAQRRCSLPRRRPRQRASS